MKKREKKNLQIAMRHNSKIVTFENLPIEYQYSLIYYMAIDGEAWDVSDQLAIAFEKSWKVRYKDYLKGQAIIKRALKTKASLNFYVELYGNWNFGIVEIPTEKMIRSVMQVRDIKRDFNDFQSYQKWFQDNCNRDKHPKKNRWPCILSSYNDEVLEDGWHRFHRYSKRGDSTIPCIYYPNNCRPKKALKTA